MTSITSPRTTSSMITSSSSMLSSPSFASTSILVPSSSSSLCSSYNGSSCSQIFERFLMAFPQNCTRCVSSPVASLITTALRAVAVAVNAEPVKWLSQIKARRGDQGRADWRSKKLRTVGSRTISCSAWRAGSIAPLTALSRFSLVSAGPVTRPPLWGGPGAHWRSSSLSIDERISSFTTKRLILYTYNQQQLVQYRPKSVQ
ncbi:hypothetical protein B0T18DRAFT_404777 [Schizothecium vesticola]|uniref:Uncharacterized protein n=1 Tax=Schizothecium vesticola TaxID=314040 RepID=A0AA40KAU8_9PEZI|nr:hypothetical protein B0T18DRAFT_404777 [Schizothecium vesticola]